MQRLAHLVFTTRHGLPPGVRKFIASVVAGFQEDALGHPIRFARPKPWSASGRSSCNEAARQPYDAGFKFLAARKPKDCQAGPMTQFLQLHVDGGQAVGAFAVATTSQLSNPTTATSSGIEH
jgi:hypothetical protein